MRNLDWKIKQSVRVVNKAYEKWDENIGIAFTGKKDSTVLAHLICENVKKNPKAVFIDHGQHFSETVENVVRVSKKLGLELIIEKDDNSHEKYTNKQLRKHIIDFKIKSIQKVVKDNKWKALYTAIRWDEQPARSNENYFSKRDAHYRVHPLLHFTEEDIWQYIRLYKLPYNPLYDLGYRSIGEKGFTKKTDLIKDKERSGRDSTKEDVMERLRSLGYF